MVRIDGKIARKITNSLDIQNNGVDEHNLT